MGVSLGGFMRQTMDWGTGAGMQRSRPTLHDKSKVQRKAYDYGPQSILVSVLFCSASSPLLYSILSICPFFPSVCG